MITTLCITLLVGFTQVERDILRNRDFRTDNCMGFDSNTFSHTHQQHIVKVIINCNCNFEEEYTKLYCSLSSIFSISMYSYDINTHAVVDEVNHFLLFKLNVKKFNEHILNQFGYIDSQHLYECKINKCL